MDGKDGASSRIQNFTQSCLSGCCVTSEMLPGGCITSTSSSITRGGTHIAVTAQNGDRDFGPGCRSRRSSSLLFSFCQTFQSCLKLELSHSACPQAHLSSIPASAQLNSTLADNCSQTHAPCITHGLPPFPRLMFFEPGQGPRSRRRRLLAALLCLLPWVQRPQKR